MKMIQFITAPFFLHQLHLSKDNDAHPSLKQTSTPAHMILFFTRKKCQLRAAPRTKMQGTFLSYPTKRSVTSASSHTIPGTKPARASTSWFQHALPSALTTTLPTLHTYFFPRAGPLISWCCTHTTHHPRGLHAAALETVWVGEAFDNVWEIGLE
jgi:hypothetical protein